VIEDGKLVLKNLAREWMHPETLQSDLRIRGEEHLRETKEAWIETKGKLSVIKARASKPVQKKDKHLFG
jgi:uncharacterized membrane protein YcaP (DUF421 family)